jgi:hypothetical protein
VFHPVLEALVVPLDFESLFWVKAIQIWRVEDRFVVVRIGA